ncbi:hypothetical protein LY78DRAFT_726300 [Colletotrichum sublineola]|nr:hypothetical protein LY78DRAFT_726300 [Colletotrichum sublineola]
MLDVNRLYKGHHGIVYKLCYHDSSPIRERRSSLAPALTTSYSSTLPFETIPRCEGESPPPYDKYPNDGQSQRATAIFAESPAGDVAPLEYGNTKQLHTNMPEHSQGGRDDADKHPLTKRKHSLTNVCTETGATDISRREKIPRYQSIDLGQSSIAHLLKLQSQRLQLLEKQVELQNRQIRKLERRVRKLQGQVEDVETRTNKLEENCSRLEKRQDQPMDDIKNLKVDVNKLEGKYKELKKLIQDVCKEFNNLRENMIGTLEEANYKSYKDITEHIEKSVKAGTDEIKRTLRQALQ